MLKDDRYWQAKKVTLIGALINALLGLAKLIGGYCFHSHALIADGIHSFSDLLTDIMVLFASKYGSNDADESHPYGHQRIETAGTLLLSLVLSLAGFGIAWDALSELLRVDTTSPGWLTLPIICLSILSNEGLFHYTLSIGKRINSSLIIANAWHHRSDAASSLVVLIGLLGTLAGFSYLDAVAAVIVGLMIIKMGWSTGWSSVRELIDTSVSVELLSQIKQVIKNTHGVEKIHQLRSRSMGNDVLIDVHIMVAPRISVSEGHYIAQHVHQAIMNQITSVKDVIVHVDHEDDETCSPSLQLPSRKVIEEQVLNTIQLDLPQILFWNVHYLDGTLSIDITCKDGFTKWTELHQRVLLAMNNLTTIKELRLFSLHEVIQSNENKLDT